MLAFVVLDLVFSVLSQEIGWKNVSEVSTSPYGLWDGNARDSFVYSCTIYYCLLT